MNREQWLRDLLADGPVPSAEVKAQGKAAGMGVSTVKRLAHKIGVVSEDKGFPRKTYWSLGNEPTEPTEPTAKHVGSVGAVGSCRCGAATTVFLSGLCKPCDRKRVEDSWKRSS